MKWVSQKLKDFIVSKVENKVDAEAVIADFENDKYSITWYSNGNIVIATEKLEITFTEKDMDDKALRYLRYELEGRAKYLHMRKLFPHFNCGWALFNNELI